VTGSGNETAAHLLESKRMTLMFCSFESAPLILRLYGSAQTVYSTDDAWNELSTLFPQYSGARQIYDMSVDLVQTSCGFAVPFFDFIGPRDSLEKWSDQLGEEKLRAYWEEKNCVSLDGKPTGLPAEMLNTQ
jgi:hypothetical protein